MCFRFTLVRIMFAFLLTLSAIPNAMSKHRRCRSQPGDDVFPTTHQLSQLNSSIGGRLVHVVPSAQFCKQRESPCTEAEWSDPFFRSEIPGAMMQVNWEQEYASQPPSFCFYNSSSECNQGRVPLYAINATSAAHIQAGVLFARSHNLRVAIKASGHDFLGRSTAKSSLLLWTHNLRGITFHKSFIVAGKTKGSAVTVESGVPLSTLYKAAKAQGLIYVGGTAQTVVASGGYIQGGGHSSLAPKYGLAADNALEFEVVLASGDLVTVNEDSHPDLFWALRGGGAGSWGVIISATFRTFPTFDFTHHEAIISLETSSDVARLAELHARHIFDWDDLYASQYSIIQALPTSSPPFLWILLSFIPDSPIVVVNASFTPFMNAVSAQGFNILSTSINTTLVNDLLTSPTAFDLGGNNAVWGSRLVPADVYRHSPKAVGETYEKLLNAGAKLVIESLVAGGKFPLLMEALCVSTENKAGRVAENAYIDSAINSKWRTAKAHVLTSASWPHNTPLDDVESIRADFTNSIIPILSELAGDGSASYSNEADVREPDFQTTFFGDKYERLMAIKNVYDPTALFIVPKGVGSEKWDEDGLCRIEDPEDQQGEGSSEYSDHHDEL